MYNQLDVYLQLNSIINNGFRAHHTAQDLYVGMVDYWRNALDRDELVDSIMLDLVKPLTILNMKYLFIRCGIKSEKLKWFRDCLSHKIQ